jgi:hypothetical protein
MEVENNQDKSNHGGARQGAGRKPGSLNAKTRAIAEKLMAENLTPLDIMVEAYTQLKKENNLIEAAKIAKDAAPYIHPRLANVELSGDAENPLEIHFGWMK